jgi:hypothetical protein
MHNDNNGTMMSQRYVEWYDIPKPGYGGSDCESNMSDRAQDDIIPKQVMRAVIVNQT